MSVLSRYKQWTHAVVRMVNAPRADDYGQIRARYILAPAQRQALFDAAALMVARGLAHATTGEISARLHRTQLVISAAGADLARFTERDLTVASTDTDVALPQAARHLDWHRAIYAATAAGGVIFCQPPHALALANAGRRLEAGCADVFEAIGGVQIVTDADVGAHAAAAHALLLPQVGALVWGVSVRDALGRAEALEYAARLTVVAALLRT